MKITLRHTTMAMTSLLTLFTLRAGSTAAHAASPICLGGSGAYCGNDEMSGADKNTLYQCPGANQAPTSSQLCTNSCVIAPAGVADYCKPASGPLCLGSTAGAYCGDDEMSGANPNTLYQCPGPNKAPTSSQTCASDCVIAPAGMPDYCGNATPMCLDGAGSYCGDDWMSGANTNTLYQCPGANKAPLWSQVCANGCTTAAVGSDDFCTFALPYKLPWSALTMQLSQDCHEGDHVGNSQYSWDFARPGAAQFPVRAARAGTVAQLKINSVEGCGEATCQNKANYLVIDHGDGTSATYLHLKGNSLAPGLSCGAKVNQGQVLATAGTTGWSTATHLHFHVSKTHASAPKCTCGTDGKGCNANSVTWANFWPSATYPNLPIGFAEWPAATSCDDREMTMPVSKN